MVTICFYSAGILTIVIVIADLCKHNWLRVFIIMNRLGLTKSQMTGSEMV